MVDMVANLLASWERSMAQQAAATTSLTAPARAPTAREEATAFMESAIDRPLSRSAVPTLVPPTPATCSMKCRADLPMVQKAAAPPATIQPSTSVVMHSPCSHTHRREVPLPAGRTSPVRVPPRPPDWRRAAPKQDAPRSLSAPSPARREEPRYLWWLPVPARPPDQCEHGASPVPSHPPASPRDQELAAEQMALTSHLRYALVVNHRKVMCWMHQEEDQINTQPIFSVQFVPLLTFTLQLLKPWPSGQYSLLISTEINCCDDEVVLAATASPHIYQWEIAWVSPLWCSVVCNKSHSFSASKTKLLGLFSYDSEYFPLPSDCLVNLKCLAGEQLISKENQLVEKSLFAFYFDAKILSAFYLAGDFKLAFEGSWHGLRFYVAEYHPSPVQGRLIFFWHYFGLLVIAYYEAVPCYRLLALQFSVGSPLNRTNPSIKSGMLIDKNFERFSSVNSWHVEALQHVCPSIESDANIRKQIGELMNCFQQGCLKSSCVPSDWGVVQFSLLPWPPPNCNSSILNQFCSLNGMRYLHCFLPKYALFSGAELFPWIIAWRVTETGILQAMQYIHFWVTICFNQQLQWYSSSHLFSWIPVVPGNTWDVLASIASIYSSDMLWQIAWGLHRSARTCLFYYDMILVDTVAHSNVICWVFLDEDMVHYSNNACGQDTPRVGESVSIQLHLSACSGHTDRLQFFSVWSFKIWDPRLFHATRSREHMVLHKVNGAMDFSSHFLEHLGEQTKPAAALQACSSLGTSWY